MHECEGSRISGESDSKALTRRRALQFRIKTRHFVHEVVKAHFHFFFIRLGTCHESPPLTLHMRSKTSLSAMKAGEKLPGSRPICHFFATSSESEALPPCLATVSLPTLGALGTGELSPYWMRVFFLPSLSSLPPPRPHFFPLPLFLAPQTTSLRPRSQIC